MNNQLKKILVTGAGGQLGSEFKALAGRYPQFEFLFTAKNDLPIGDRQAVKEYFNLHKPGNCINCAAYTAVDKAESEKEQAYLVNGEAAGILAEACRNQGTRLVHISTDYVFDGNSQQPFKETDPTHPINVYGASKLKGEELVMQHHPGAVIIRSSWIYSAYGNNFVKTMLRLMKERTGINVVNDQFGSPTYAADLAEMIMVLIEKFPGSKNPTPILHYCNEGMISWYAFALEIKKLTGSPCIVNPIPTSQYPTAAARPHYSVLDTTATRELLQIKIPKWEDSLRKCLQLLA